MKRILIAGAITLVVAATALGAFLGGSRLRISGHLVSTGVIEQNGTAYVPIRDVATALKMNLTHSGNVYDLSTGGAGQIEGVNGKVGDILWNGYAHFQVVSVTRAKTYTNQFSPGHEQIKPNNVGYDLVVVVCNIRNGTSDAVTCLLPGAENTAMTDTAAHSYGIRTADIDCPTNGPHLLPGALVDFAITFEVPPDATLKDLVYQARFYGTKAENKKFRVSVANN